MQLGPELLSSFYMFHLCIHRIVTLCKGAFTPAILGVNYCMTYLHNYGLHCNCNSLDNRRCQGITSIHLTNANVIKAIPKVKVFLSFSLICMSLLYNTLS